MPPKPAPFALEMAVEDVKTATFTMSARFAKALGRYWLLKLPKNAHFVRVTGPGRHVMAMFMTVARFAKAPDGLTYSKVKSKTCNLQTALISHL